MLSSTPCTKPHATNDIYTYIQNDTALNEIIKQYRSAAKPIEFAQQQTDQIVGQPIAKCGQGGLQLVLIDVAGIVRIERPEAILPIGHVLPQSAEVLEADRAAVLLIEHADHQTHGFRIEGAPRAVRQSDLQLVRGDEAAVVLVDTNAMWVIHIPLNKTTYTYL